MAKTSTDTAKFKLEKPRLAAAGLEQPAHPLFADSGSYHENLLVREAAVEERNTERSVAERVLWQHVTFADCRLDRLELTDCRFENCDLSNIRLDGAVLHRVEFHSCKLVGADLSGAVLRNVLFEDCQADYASFRFGNFKGVKFSGSSLNHADLYRSELAKTAFEDVQLDRAQLSGTRLSGIDLSTCEFHHLGVEMEDLKGCIIAPAQAILFTRIFGLVVKE
ncbi:MULTISPECIES: pentapeptide repeat-containing protein [unclassified Paenibacillus]|uniref:pentapeptide repeat-containing protein n=1 Tax=unclassified Paenibacillus TaxID=185978 RepID=UPI0009557A4A|nr:MULTISPECIES: pentapeptide repeat-containing protein [unclassified Paenibacillus]ASS64981.1 pentapeptide repeat-containing protein [Paenibacillus sp. RUD330]SIQ52608.1 Uncharacterized protein YjbI, contains pentapeptide repeats [Paenibacillus sp. RU4X]SIQ74981.1 Uncharacterized protein YjbI, contains pentapeptide repeats [Paenibacillus sp. RU4T]